MEVINLKGKRLEDLVFKDKVKAQNCEFINCTFQTEYLVYACRFVNCKFYAPCTGVNCDFTDCKFGKEEIEK